MAARDPASKAGREARRAEALRENLKRRKAQQVLRDGKDGKNGKDAETKDGHA